MRGRKSVFTPDDNVAMVYFEDVRRIVINETDGNSEWKHPLQDILRCEDKP